MVPAALPEEFLTTMTLHLHFAAHSPEGKRWPYRDARPRLSLLMCLLALLAALTQANFAFAVDANIGTGPQNLDQTPTADTPRMWSASVTASEEYNDNVNEQASPQGDFVSTISPQASFDYTGKRTAFSLRYSGKWHQYALGNHTNELLNTLEAKATAQVIANLLRLDVSDSNKMVFSNATLGESSSSDATNSQVNQNTFSQALTLTPEVWERTPVSLGATASETTYSNGDGINKNQQAVFLDVLHNLTPRLEIGGGARVSREESSVIDVERLSATGVFRYTYAEGSYIFCRGGAIHSLSQGDENDWRPLVSAGLNHLFGRTTLTLNAQSGYTDNPSGAQDIFKSTISANVSQQFTRSTLSINTGVSSYSGQSTSNNQQLNAGFTEYYELTSRLSTTISGSFITNTSSAQTLNRIYASSEIQYDLPNDYKLSAWYRHKFSQSSSGSSSTYHVNMIGLGLKKTF